MRDFRSYPRLSEDERKDLRIMLQVACDIVTTVTDRLEGTYDGQMTFGLETTAADHLFPSMALSDARDALHAPVALTSKQKRAQHKKQKSAQHKRQPGGEQ